ncbi:oxaloacetate decarboxylase, partial [Pasteurella multocida subsp. multocida str. Anand1_cattle]
TCGENTSFRTCRLHRGIRRQILCSESHRRGEVGEIAPAAQPTAQTAPQPAPASTSGTPVSAPMSGNIWKVVAKEGQKVAEGDVLLILEAMKMETEIRASQAGTVQSIHVKSRRYCCRLAIP